MAAPGFPLNTRVGPLASLFGLAPGAIADAVMSPNVIGTMDLSQLLLYARAQTRFATVTFNAAGIPQVAFTVPQGKTWVIQGMVGSGSFAAGIGVGAQLFVGDPQGIIYLYGPQARTDPNDGAVAQAIHCVEPAPVDELWLPPGFILGAIATALNPVAARNFLVTVRLVELDVAMTG